MHGVGRTAFQLLPAADAGHSASLSGRDTEDDDSLRCPKCPKKLKDLRRIGKPLDTIVMNPNDNVAVVLREIAPHELLQVGEDTVTARDRIPYGHKIARKAIAAGNHILKYGMAVGRAVADIPQGGHVHVHNVTSLYQNNEQNHYE